MKNKGWSSKFPLFSSVPLVNSNEYKLPQKNRCRIQRKKLVRNAREDTVRSSCKSSLLITWENISIWHVPQSIPIHGEKTGDIENAQHFTKMGNGKNTWQPCCDLKATKASAPDGDNWGFYPSRKMKPWHRLSCFLVCLSQIISPFCSIGYSFMC